MKDKTGFHDRVSTGGAVNRHGALPRSEQHRMAETAQCLEVPPISDNRQLFPTCTGKERHRVDPSGAEFLQRLAQIVQEPNQTPAVHFRKLEPEST